MGDCICLSLPPSTAPHHTHTKIFPPPKALPTAKEISAGTQLLLISLAVDWVIHSPKYNAVRVLQTIRGAGMGTMNSCQLDSIIQLGVLPLGTFWLKPCSEQAAQEPLQARSE